MLILTRRINESIRIGDDISITVLGINGNQVRLGFDAPKEVGVHREEIYQRIRQESDPNYVPPPPPMVDVRKPAVTVRSRNRFLGGVGLGNAV